MGPSRASIISTYINSAQLDLIKAPNAERRANRPFAYVTLERAGVDSEPQNKRLHGRSALARSRAQVQGWHILFSHCSCALVWQLRVRRSARLLWIVGGNFAVSQSRHRPRGRSPGSLRLVRCRWSLCWLAGDWPCPYCLCGTVCSIDVVDLESST
jgi:hypothetical protein